MIVKPVFDAYDSYGVFHIVAEDKNHPKAILDLGCHPQTYAVSFLRENDENGVRVSIRLINHERTRRADLFGTDFKMTVYPTDMNFQADFSSYEAAAAWFKSFLSEFPECPPSVFDAISSSLDAFKKQRDLRLAFEEHAEKDKKDKMTAAGCGHLGFGPDLGVAIRQFVKPRHKLNLDTHVESLR